MNPTALFGIRFSKFESKRVSEICCSAFLVQEIKRMKSNKHASTLCVLLNTIFILISPNVRKKSVESNLIESSCLCYIRIYRSWHAHTVLVLLNRSPNCPDSFFLFNCQVLTARLALSSNSSVGSSCLKTRTTRLCLGLSS